MENKTWLLITMGVIAGISGYYAFSKTNAIGGIIVTGTISWILYMFSSKGQAWKAFSMLKNPFAMSIISFFTGYSYFALKGWNNTDSFIAATGLGLFGGATGIFLFHYWNIGEP